MKCIVNAVIVLFSLCIAILIGTNLIGIVFYIGLIAIEYALVLLLNADFRKATKHFFNREGTFGSGNKCYGEIHLETLKEDIEKIEPISFEYFIGDLFTKLGYKTRVTEKSKDFGGDIIAKKGKEITVIQVKHRDSNDWNVSNDAVQQAVAAMPVYKGTKSMVVTNGIFTEHAYKQASYTNTAMIDGEQLLNLVRQVMERESKTPSQELSHKPPIEETSQEGEQKDENRQITSIETVLMQTIPEVTLESTLENQEEQAVNSNKPMKLE